VKVVADWAGGLPFAAEADGVRVAVRLTPRGGRDALAGVAAGPDCRALLRIRVSAPAVEGAANTALTGFLASALGVRKSAVVIRSGEQSRIKILHVAGDSGVLCARLPTWIKAPAGGVP